MCYLKYLSYISSALCKYLSVELMGFQMKDTRIEWNLNLTCIIIIMLLELTDAWSHAVDGYYLHPWLNKNGRKSIVPFHFPVCMYNLLRFLTIISFYIVQWCPSLSLHDVLIITPLSSQNLNTQNQLYQKCSYGWRAVH